MIALSGEFLKGIQVGREVIDLSLHLVNLLPKPLDFGFLILYLQGGAAPVKDAVVREKYQPHPHNQRYDDYEREEVIMVTPGEPRPYFLSVCHLPRNYEFYSENTS